MTNEAAVIAAAIITVVGTLLATYLQVRPNRGPVLSPGLPAGKDDGRRLPRIKKLKRLRCGAIKHPPLSDVTFSERDRPSFSGYYVELARVVARRTGVRFDFVPIDWNDFAEDVFQKRQVDLVLSVFETSERRDYASFACHFHRIGLCALVRDASELSSLRDLDRPNLRWALSKGEAGWEYAIQERGVKSRQAVVVEHPSIAAALDVLSAGGADVAVADRLTCEQYLRSHPTAGLRAISEGILDFKNAIMVPRNDEEFERWVSAEFRSARLTPQMQALEEKMLTECGGVVTKYA